MSKWITAATFARSMGCSRANVTQAVQTGRIQPQFVRRDGTSMRINTGCIPDWEATSTRHRQDGLLPMAWGKPEAATPVAEMTDDQLAGYCNEHLGDAALDAAMAPIDRWTDNQMAPDWQHIAAHLNGFLGDKWPAPPWDGEQVNTLAMALVLAQEAAGG